MDVDKTKMKGHNGSFITQSLFLEPQYDTKFAVYTLKDEDHEFEGKTYHSLKRLYLEMEDVTEYEFANTYLCGWKHWKRLLNNNMINDHFEEWREELELKLRSQAIRDIVNITAEGAQGSFQAAKWLADGGWNKRGAGRPSNAEKQRESRIKDRMADEYLGDVARMSDYKGK